jgi:hypothetical protein
MSCKQREQLGFGSDAMTRFKFKDGTRVASTVEDCMRYVKETYNETGYASEYIELADGSRKDRGAFAGVWCWRECPDSSCNGWDAGHTPTQSCNPRPLLTKLEIFYTVLKDKAKSCVEKISAYRDAVEENNGDYSSIGFTDECPNPYAEQKQDGVVDPSASNGDPTKPQDAPPMDSGMPYIPDVPPASRTYDPIASDTSPPNSDLPTSRITLTGVEADMFPKVNDYSMMSDDTLAQMIKFTPTYVDANPEYLTECEKYIPNFVWSCIPTQAQFDLLQESHKCLLAENYSSLYTNPSIIKEMRKFAPSITITRDAPPITPPHYNQNIEQQKREQCEVWNANRKTHKTATGITYVDEPCVYSGGCNGHCDCPPPKCENIIMGHDTTGTDLSYNTCDPEDSRPKAWWEKDGNDPWSSLNSPWLTWIFDNIFLIGGGIVVVGVGGYGVYVYSRASAVAVTANKFGTSLNSIGIGGFKLVPV